MCVCVCVCVCVCAVTGRAMLDQSAYSTTYVCAGNQRSPALGEGVGAQGSVVEGAGGWGFVWEMVRRICGSDAGGGGGGWGRGRVSHDVVFVRKGWRLHAVSSIESVASWQSGGVQVRLLLTNIHLQVLQYVISTACCLSSIESVVGCRLAAGVCRVIGASKL